MRHRVKGKKLSRDMDHRKALLRNLSRELILHGSIETTLAKAKYVRPFIEKLITRASRNKNYETVRLVRSRLVHEDAVRKLFDEVAPKFKEKKGGYTRVVRVGNRDGDNAMMARIEFTE